MVLFGLPLLVGLCSLGFWVFGFLDTLFPPVFIYSSSHLPCIWPRQPCPAICVSPSQSAPCLFSCFVTSLPSPEFFHPSPHLDLIFSLVQLVFKSWFSVQSGLDPLFWFVQVSFCILFCSGQPALCFCL